MNIPTLIILIIVSVVGYAVYSSKKKIPREKYIFTGFIILLFTTIYCVSFLHYKISGDKFEISLMLEKAKKDFVDIAKIRQLGDMVKWENVYGGNRESYKSLIELEREINDPETHQIILSEIKAIESIYRADIMSLWIERPIAICKFIAEPGKSPCSEGFEPPKEYDAENVFNHLDNSIWFERARAARLLRNIETSPNKNKVNEIVLFDKLIQLMKHDSSLFVAKMAFETYKDLTGFQSDSAGVFVFDTAFKDWETRKKKLQNRN